MTQSHEERRDAPLDEVRLRAALLEPAGPASAVTVLPRVDSTNRWLLDRARDAAPFTVVAAEDQHAGRGRLGRGWLTPPGRALTCSILVPQLPPQRLAWLPMTAGAAVIRAVARHGIEARLKWPNDVIVTPPQAPELGRWGAWRKLAGILIELPGRAGPAGAGSAVVGIGINVNQRPSELPVPWAIAMCDATRREVDRTDLLCTLVTELAIGYDGLAIGDVSRIRLEMMNLLAGIGVFARVALPGGEECTGTVDGIDESARLLLRDKAGSVRALAAGDVAIQHR